MFSVIQDAFYFLIYLFIYFVQYLSKFRKDWWWPSYVYLTV